MTVEEFNQRMGIRNVTFSTPTATAAKTITLCPHCREIEEIFGTHIREAILIIKDWLTQPKRKEQHG